MSATSRPLPRAAEALAEVVAPSLAPKFRVLALPGVWTEAQVTLHSPTANGAYSAVKHSRTLLRSAFFGSPLEATANFPPLRPGTDYVAQAFLKNDAGTIVTKRLAGSKVNSTVTLAAGANTLAFTITVNGDEPVYETSVATSNNNNNRTIDFYTPYVSTLAGDGTPGLIDDVGIGAAAQFNSPRAFCFDGADTVYVSDTDNGAVRKFGISTQAVSTLTTGLKGPEGITLDGGQNYVSDTAAHLLVRVDPSTGALTTIVGQRQQRDRRQGFVAHPRLRQTQHHAAPPVASATSVVLAV